MKAVITEIGQNTEGSATETLSSAEWASKHHCSTCIRHHDRGPVMGVATHVSARSKSVVGYIYQLC